MKVKENIQSKIKNKALAGFISKYGGIITVIILMSIFTSIFRPSFFRLSNILQLLVNNNSIFLAGLGMTFVILSGGIDLSQGALAAFSTMVAALLIKWGIPVPLAIILTVIVGALVGILNGAIVSVAKVHSFVVTLGMTTVLRGFAVAVNGGYPIPIDVESALVAFGNGKSFGIPNAILVCIAAFAVSLFILRETNLGRNVYAIGGNPESARFSGISVIKTTIFSFAMSSALTALAGVILAARMFSGLPSASVGLETSAVTAVIIGGTSFTGGDGSVVGTAFGVIMLAILVNAMVMFGLPAWSQDVINGVIIIIAVVYDKMRTKTA